MRWLLTGLSMVLALVGCAPRAELSLAEFQDRVVAELGRRYPTAKVERVGENTLHVHFDDAEEPGVLNLDRAYALYEAAPSELAALVRQMAATLDPYEFSSADSLVVLVRPSSFETDLARPLAGGLLAVVAIDLPERYAFVPSEELRVKLKLDNEAIWKRAEENTRRLLNFAPIEVRPGKPAFIETEAGLATSVLAFDDIWDSPELTATGPLVVAIISRDNIHIAALSDGEAVARMRRGMAALRDDPNGLTNDLLVRRDGRWEVLE